ncbi:MAG TPA: S41 family peptidase [candidate division Zixibacteria bacterium]|nr:S41 family peptidase [candidate division Zixibacteria bacterium]MDD4917654.1 S41 family peptidase [candidate division Zixibacteria bacterium]MDM7974058.1 S41 family peptidase [candidate division Zixibacteria bacterium]HOD65528.1 S41 family peptidase [candidate division Zixibacteria bacterium]HPM36966.1 S41 family peptidase [candidate division Zixibacteria bacterium]
MKTRMLKTSCLSLALLMLPLLMHAQETGTVASPETVFDHVWQTVDRTYGQFGSKHVDWAALYRVYRPQITAETSDGDLHRILLEMLGHLNDAHVCIQTDTSRTCCGLTEGLPRVGFSRELIESHYLKGTADTALDGRLLSGWLTDQIGYMYLRNFKSKPDELSAAIDGCMKGFAAASALIVDVRDNTGGKSENSELVADRFADRKRHFATSFDRYGEKHDDYLPPTYRNIEPAGPIQFTGPMVVLTDRHTASAAEEFVLAMRVLPHVTIVGDLTEGALAAQYPERLPNGWTLWVAHKYTIDLEGVCWDGVGIPPDVRITNTQADIDSGQDRVLQFALLFLETGRPEPQMEPASLDGIRTSLVQEFKMNLDKSGFEFAVNDLRSKIKGGDQRYFFSVVEMLELSREYVSRDEFKQAIELLEILRAEYPRFAHTYGLLAAAYLNSENQEAARTVVAEGERIKAMYSWEKPLLEKVKQALEEQ